VVATARRIELDRIKQIPGQQHHVTGRTHTETGFNAANELSHRRTALSARSFQGIPEAAAQRVPGLVVQQ
jgi:hypothetical protein